MKSILVVEDDDHIRAVLAEVLRMEGYLVTLATNGQSALQALHTIEPPGLILLDLMMPVMDGWEFLAVRETDSDFARIPVVVISAGQRTKPPRAQEFMAKPIELESLLSMVRQYCG